MFAVGLTNDVEARWPATILHLEHAGEVRVELQRQPSLDGVIGVSTDGQVVVHRPCQPSPQREVQRTGRQLTAGATHLRVLKREGGAAVTLAVAAEQLPLLTADHD